MNISEKLDKVRFLPWVGKNYKNGGIFNKRILVLGESHYCGCCDRKDCENAFYECCREFTKNAILKYFYKPNENEEKWMRTYTKFEHSLVGKSETTIEEKIKIWDSIAFYNFLQYAIDDKRKSGESDAYKAAEKPFFQVLNYLKPELIIAWGVTRFYKEMPEENWTHCENLKYDNKHIKNGKYELSNGKRVPIVFINHPSSGYNLDFWHNVIKNFLK